MIEFDPDGAKAYAQRQVEKECNVILPPPPFNCRVSYQEQLEIQRDGIMVTGVCRFGDDASRGETFFTWEDIGYWIVNGRMSTDRNTIGRVIRLYYAKEKGEV